MVTTETIGAEEKDWLEGQGARWLFKPVTVKSEEPQGEDWAEKAASHLAGLIDVPCARVELAVRNGEPGALSRDLRPPKGFQLQSGALLLVDRGVPNFVPARQLDHDKALKRQRPGHSLRSIQWALQGVAAPPDSGLPETFDAFDTFAGYLVLDAWIGNRDRHDENWSVLIPELQGGTAHLCGSYDQANSLGYNLRNAERERRLRLGPGHDLLAYARKGTAWRFENGPSQPIRSLVELAVDALLMAKEEARSYWAGKIMVLDSLDTASLLGRIDSMSVLARTFACRLLETNGRRLRDELDSRI